MRFGRGSQPKAKPVSLPQAADSITLIPAAGERLPARVLERGVNTLLVAIMVPHSPLTALQLEGLELEVVGTRGRIRLAGEAALPDPGEPDVVRIDNPRPLEVLQEREWVRIGANRPVLVFHGDDQPPVTSYTANLSGGGFLLAGPDLLRVGEEFGFQITLVPGELVITGTAKVMRLDNEGRRAVSFVSLSPVDQRRLVRFLFDFQRVERHREMEMRDRGGG